MLLSNNVDLKRGTFFCLTFGKRGNRFRGEPPTEDDRMFWIHGAASTSLYSLYINDGAASYPCSAKGVIP